MKLFDSMYIANCCSASAYFEKAFCGGWKESDGRMALPEDDPRTFALLVHWLRTGKFNIIHFTMRVEGVANSLRLYVLVDKLQFLPMLPVIMDSIRSVWQLIFRDFKPEEINYIYDNTPPSSKLRRLAIERTAYAFTASSQRKARIQLCSGTVGESAFDWNKVIKHASDAGQDLIDPYKFRPYYAQVEKFKESQQKAEEDQKPCDTAPVTTTSLCGTLLTHRQMLTTTSHRFGELAMILSPIPQQPESPL